MYTPIQTSTVPLNSKLKNILWGLCNKTIFRYSPRILRKWRILLVRIFGGNIDYSCSLHPKTIIDYPWNLKMAHQASLGENTWAYGLDKIDIGKNTCIGKDVYLLTGSHDISSKNFDLQTAPILIEEGCWLATGCYILPGIKIEKYSVISAGSIVVKNVEAFSVIGGNPANFIKKRIIND